MKQTLQKWILMCAVILALIASISLAGIGYALTENNMQTISNENDYEEEHTCPSDNGWDYLEEKLEEEVEMIYLQHALQYDQLEEEIEGQYELLMEALEGNDDDNILREAKGLYALELQIEALDETTGIAALYDELDLIEENCVDDYEDEAEEAD